MNQWSEWLTRGNSQGHTSQDCERNVKEEAELIDAVRKGDSVAFGQLVPKSGNRFHLARLIAAPEGRGSGLGRLITVHLLDVALARKPAAVSLNVFSENLPAITLYKSLGFVAATRPPGERQSASLYMEHAAGLPTSPKERK